MSPRVRASLPAWLALLALGAVVGVATAGRPGAAPEPVAKGGAPEPAAGDGGAASKPQVPRRPGMSAKERAMQFNRYPKPSDEQLKKTLDPLQYRVTQQEG